LKYAAVKIIALSLRDIWEDLWTCLICNWVWLISNLLIIPGPPVTLALFYYTNQHIHGETVSIIDFFKAIPRLWRLGWRWGIINDIVLVLLLGDFLLVGKLSQSAGAHFFQGLYLAVLSFWLLLQVFTLAFLFEQEIPSMKIAFRNGSALIGKNLLFSFTLLVLLLIVLSLGVVAFMLTAALGGVFVAFAANRAVSLDIRKID